MRAQLVRGTVAAALGLSLVCLPAFGSQAEPEVDSRWVPWLGCWQLWEEQFERAEQLENDDSIVGRTSVCVTPTTGGVLLTAAAGNVLLVERQLVADGARREVEENGCHGWEQSEWSTDGQRLFTRGELTCDDSPVRSVNGVSLMASASSWVDIQLVRFGDREQLELRRYAPLPAIDTQARLGSEALPVEPAEIRRARREGAETPNLRDVLEAGRRTTPRVVEAMLVETEPDLDLDADALIALDDAGIDHGVIDLLVALAYPERFVVERRDRAGSWSSGLSSGYGFGRPYDPIWYGDLYPYYVTPWGSRSWIGGYNPYLYGAAASPFVVLPTAGFGEPVTTGRAVSERGYTRVRPRQIEAPAQVSSGGSRRTGASTGGSSSGPTATSGGYRGGGSTSGGSRSGGGSTGRRAVPRSR